MIRAKKGEKTVYDSLSGKPVFSPQNLAALVSLKTMPSFMALIPTLASGLVVIELDDYFFMVILQQLV